MRLSSSQKSLVTALFESVHANRQPARARSDDAHPNIDCGPQPPSGECDDGSAILRRLDRTTFFRTVERASLNAERAAQTARQLTIWAVRLAPYLDRDDGVTVQEAHDAYLRDAAMTRLHPH